MLSPKFLGMIAVMCLGGLSFTTLAAPHMGEDGIEYPDSGGVVKRDGWARGKIEPRLSQAAETATELNVVIYLQPPGNSANHATPASIKAQHHESMEALGGQIRNIVKRYRPDWSMTEEEEKHYTEVFELALTDSDKQQLQDLKEQLDQERDTMHREIAQAIAEQVSTDQETLVRFITARGGEVHTRIASGNALGARIPSSLLNQLADHPLVRSITDDRPPEYELNISVPSVQYDAWWNSSPTPITGTPYDFGIVDEGVQENHPAFSCVNAYYKPAGAAVTGDHGTHVTGIVVSCDATYQGGVQDIDAVIWSNAGGQSTTMSNMDWMATSALQGPEVINHSLGYGTANTVDYNDNDSFYDAFIETFDIMVTKSAGNNGWSATDPTITHPAPAYNLMAVGNVNDMNTITRSDDGRYDDVTYGSSVGPTVGGRKKPDISAPGTNIISTNADWATEADFISKTGTSMAAPHVAAAIVLMEDGGNNTPIAQKAVLINTADAWDSMGTSSNSDDVPVTGSHWDKAYGWGYIDEWESHFNRDDYFIGTLVPRNDNATDDDYKLYKGTMYNGEKATMVWEKRADTYVAGAPSTGRRTLSDLNLRLYNEADGVLISSDLDGNDNVHQVAANATMTAVLKAYSWSLSFDGATTETFALATEENFTAVTPPSFSRNYSRPNYVGPYQTFDITARVFNNGGVAAHSVNLNLQNIAGVTGGSTVNLGTIASDGGVQEHIYTLTTSGLAAGTHWLPLDVSSSSYLETYTYNTTTGVSLVVDATPPTSDCTSPAYENGTVAINWTASDTQAGMTTGTAYLYAKRPTDGSFLYTGLNQPGGSGTFSYVPGVSDGLYDFAIRARDSVGNIEGIPVTAECSTTVDRVTPISTLSTPSITGATVPMTFAITDASPSSGLEFVDFWYRKEGTAIWTYTGLFSTSLNGVLNFNPPDGDGTYYFYSRAKDNAQNIEPNPSGNGKSSSIVDTLAPTGSILINGGAATTTSLLVTLDLSASDAGSGVTNMRFSNNNVSWSAWESYATTRTNWDLSAFGGNTSTGEKKVYAQFRDGSGKVSATVADTIDYVDALAPFITGIWPGSGTIGESISVFIFGDHFLAGGTPEVYFNGVRQYIVATVSDEMLIARINVSTSLYGPVTVVTSHGTAISTTSFGVPLSGLQLTGVWPGQANNGETLSVFLFGNEFTTDGTTEVYFNGVRQFLVAPVTSEMLIVRLSATPALSGTVTIVTPSGTVNSSDPFVVLP